MDVPDEIVVEWCSNDLFKPDETNVTVVHASVHRVTLPMFLNTKNESDLLTPTQAGIMVRLSTRNSNYRSKSYSPISEMWAISSDCHGSYLDDIDPTNPWSWNCTACPRGAACDGASMSRRSIMAKSGFWRLSDNPSMIFKM